MRRFTLTLLALWSGWAGAHPVDEVVQAAYLTLAPGAVQLELDLTPGVQVVGTIIKALDPNGDGKVTAAEARTYAGRVLGQSTLSLNGVAVPWTLEKVEVPPVALLKEGGVLKIYATARRADRPGAQTLTYQNRYQPVKSQWVANIFLLPGAGWQYGVTGQGHSNDGRQLTVKYIVARS
ncbi:hypothetical protein DAETH_32540 (plasmid) [Deinococcus aetherius]|uniref:EF-hand domain-containing protein n=1 Tax=Deinococcus aetherius TaxID=200252 RepID=A0ABM8AHK5_9DEIO|nr:hypothetical protein [Deinococcus aetherius]BDP43285.1 hypothetical protein DAETH_32540 [Deinococcus aetherius]